MKYNICIIGSGAGGSPIAYELSNAGYSVVILEKGKYYREKDFNKDELEVVRREKFKPLLKDERHIIYEHNIDGTTKRYDGYRYNWSFWNGSMVGGASNLMSGYFHRMKPKDFRLKSLYGEVKGANVEDWVISYEDLAPYYDKVEKVIGVSGENMPYPALSTNGVTKWFDDSCRRLNLKPFITPRAIISKDDRERKACSYSNFCGSYGCTTGAKGSARASLLQRCSAKIITEAFVYKLDSNKSKITKAYYYDRDKNSHYIEADIFVVSAQPIETSRLLLNSKNRYFPNGIANSNNQVGKNLIFSAGGRGKGRFKFENLDKNSQKTLMELGLFFNRSLRFDDGVIDFLFESSNFIPRVIREFYDDNGDIIWGKKLQDKIDKTLTTSRVLEFEVFNNWLPTDRCFVDIEESIKDKYGVSVGAINLYGDPRDIEIGTKLAKEAVKVLKDMGAVDISYSISSNPPPNLVAGGCRFGDNPKTSVLDKNCKAHELDNLYISDASFMPTGGSVPFTWTIYANSFRVADVIIDELKNILSHNR